MKAKNTLFNEAPEAKYESGTEIKKKKQPVFEMPQGLLGDILNFIVAVVIAFVSYHVGLWLTDKVANYYVAHILGFVLALLIMKAFDSVAKSPSSVNRGVVILMVVYLCFNLANGLFGSHISLANNEPPTKAQIEEVRQKMRTDSLIAIQNDIEAKAMILPVGTHRFNLAKGDSTGWMTIPKLGRFHYLISSKSFKYKIIYSDGTPVQGTKDGTIPWRARPVFQVKAQKEETVTIVIKRIK